MKSSPFYISINTKQSLAAQSFKPGLVDAKPEQAYQFEREGYFCRDNKLPGLAKEILGWQAELNLQQMCADAWRWQSKNPNGYES